MLLSIALNNSQSADSNQRQRKETNFPQAARDLFLKKESFSHLGNMDEDKEHAPLWGEKLRKEVEETQDLEMVKILTFFFQFKAQPFYWKLRGAPN